ncbi:MAG: hypothetical protein KAI63_01505 [Planctomycetes bacterium]|nr:hypothetical protein [Planctomycetota bacterium]
MKNLFLILVIIGILAAVAGVVVMHLKKMEFYGDKLIAEKDREEAVEAKKEAETLAATAGEIKKEAEAEKIKAFTVRDAAVKEKDDALKRADTADATSREADIARMEAEEISQDALAAKKAADEARVRAEDEANQADARTEAAEHERNAYDKARLEAIDTMQGVQKDYQALAEIKNEAMEIAAFVSSVVVNVLQEIDIAEGQLAKGCELSRESLPDNNIQKRFQAVRYLQLSNKTYDKARAALKKLKKVSDSTNKVSQLTNHGIDNYVTSVQVLNAVIRSMMQGDGPDMATKQEKSELAISKKRDADQTIINVCKLLQNLIDDYEDAFPKTIKEKLKKHQQKLNDRLGEGTGEAAEESRSAAFSEK